MPTTEQIQKSMDPIIQEMASINNNLNQKLDHYMDKYGKSLDLVDEIMSIADEAYSVDSEMTAIEMANKITDAVRAYVKEVRKK